MLIQVVLYVIGAYLLLCLAYFLLQEAIIFRPQRSASEGGYRLSASYEERSFTTSSGGRIHGVLLHPKGHPRGLIFYLHGNTGSMKRWSTIAQELLELNYDVFVMDYRGYGKSRGRRVEDAMHQDAEEVFDEMAAAYRNRKVVVYGRSLGSGFAVQLAARKEVDRLVLETPFLSLVDVARHYVPFLPVYYMLRFRLRSDKFIQKVKCPILILHGTRDPIVPYRSAFALFQLVRYRDDVQMVTIPGAQHNNLNAYPTFWDSLREYLKTKAS